MTSSFTSMLVLLIIFVCVSLTSASVLRFSSAFDLSSLHTTDPHAGLNFTISLLNRPWLHSAPISFRALNRTWSAADNSLIPTVHRDATGYDSIGSYSSFTFTWVANPNLTKAQLQWETTFRLYDSNEAHSAGAIVFVQKWVTGANGTSTGNMQGVLSSFPAFQLGGPGVEEQGYLQWAGTFAFRDTKVGYWAGNGSTAKLENLGIRSGPIVLFDSQAKLASLLAPLTSFMSASVVQEGDAVHVGVLGSMESVPAGWSLETILYFENAGVSACVEHWGDVMLEKYGKVRSDAYDEFTVQYLGYNTDNGAYYYYNTEPNTTYENTMLDVQKYWESLHVPIRFVWLDSWFYFKGANGGTKNWTAMPTIFPHGLPAFHQQLRLPIVAHNRWWSAEVDYAEENGGAYKFLVESKTSKWAVPIDQRFWDDLFLNASTWGLRVYQQDWLYNEFETVVALTKQLDLGRQWLMQMGQGAANAGMSIMYCMPSPRHILQSVEIPAVKQVRASDDYIPGNNGWQNWQVALTSLLEWSLGLSPSKDDFWSTEYQPGSPYKGGHEPDPLLQSMMATLSTGQVTPSDGIGFMDPVLISRSHRADGLILKPDRPAFFPDVVFADQGLSSSPNGDYIVATYSVHDRWSWMYEVVVNTDESSSLPILVGDLFPPSIPLSDHTAYCLVQYTRQRLIPSTVSILSVASTLPNQPVLDTWEYSLLAPLLSSAEANVSVGVLGEVDKWVSMSGQRVREVRVDGEALEISMVGSEGEVVSMWYVWRDDMTGKLSPLIYAGCRIGSTHTATFRIVFTAVESWGCGEGQVKPTPPLSPASNFNVQNTAAVERGQIDME